MTALGLAAFAAMIWRVAVHDVGPLLKGQPA
jgi:hypothetical protein